jgi:hypothetical protein
MEASEWDDAKAEECFSKHKIAFEEAALALAGLALTSPSPRISESPFRLDLQLQRPDHRRGLDNKGRYATPRDFQEGKGQ